MAIPSVIIIGGGAAGLEMATQLGDKLGKKKFAHIILVDNNLTNLWKPLWHEVAAGTITSTENEANYIIQAHHHNFVFHLGSLVELDRHTQTITLSEVKGSNNEIVLPTRSLKYDYLIIAIGSIHNDFNIPGASENCYSFDSYKECSSFQQELLKKFVRIQEALDKEINIIIIGGGATGVELAAELHYACTQNIAYSPRQNLENIKFSIHLIESAPRILSALPEEISVKVEKELKKRNIKIYTEEKVSRVDKEAVYTQSGLVLRSTLKVWAAGIKVSSITTKLGLETDNLNRIVVKDTLQSAYDNKIFALGDCARCQIRGSTNLVPATAQAARQQALLLAKSLSGYIIYNKPFLIFHYKDYGSLISLSQENNIGYLKGLKLVNNVTLRGKFAVFLYRFLFRRHQAILHGWWKTFLLILSSFLTRSIRPRLKLH